MPRTVLSRIARFVSFVPVDGVGARTPAKTLLIEAALCSLSFLLRSRNTRRRGIASAIIRSSSDRPLRMTIKLHDGSSKGMGGSFPLVPLFFFFVAASEKNDMITGDPLLFPPLKGSLESLRQVLRFKPLSSIFSVNQLPG